MKNYEKFAQLQNSEAFVAALNTIETPEELQKLLQAHGVEMAMEEIEEIAKAACGSTAELSENDLDNVAGGGVVGWIFEQVCTWFAKKGLDWLASKGKK